MFMTAVDKTAVLWIITRFKVDIFLIYFFGKWKIIYFLKNPKASNELVNFFNEQQQLKSWTIIAAEEAVEIGFLIVGQ